MTRPIGKLERLYLERHARDLALASQPGGHPKGFYFDPVAAERPIQFLEGLCRHHKGEWKGKPLLLEDWQRGWIRVLFGWLRPDGSRRFRKAWVEVAKKNGKTEIAAGLGLFLEIADYEPGAEVYTTATKRDQAAICHTAAREMVRASPDLSRFVRVPKAPHAALVCFDVDPETGEALPCAGSLMKILASDAGTTNGINPNGDIRDEVGDWVDERLAGALDSSSAARRQPLTLEITTAGVYDLNGVGWLHHDYAVQILEGALEDDRLFAYIAAIDEEDDWKDPAVWGKANPNLGISPKIEFLTEQIAEAKQNPSKQNDVLRYNLNRWTQQVSRWLSLEAWKEAEDPKLCEADLRGRPCVGGLDLAEKLDLCAYVLTFEGDDGRLDFLCRFWLPEDQIENQAKKGRAFLREWAAQGWITATPGAVVDHERIRREINELRADGYAPREIAYDPKSGTQLATQLAEQDGFTMIETSQGTWALSEPAKLFESKIVEKKTRATGPPGGANPVARWMVSNATKFTDAGGCIRPDRVRSKDKIDFVSAAVTSMTRIVSGPETSGGRSMYETEGMTAV